MIGSVALAVREAWSAFKMADDFLPGCILVCDFVASRLLKFPFMPGRNRPRCVKVRGMTVHYRFNRGDIQSIREVLLEDTYRLPFELESVKTVVDLGANIGLWSLWASKTCGFAQVIAVEPDPENAKLVKKNFTDNRISGEVLEAAIGASTGSVVFQKQKESNLGRVAASGTAGGCQTVEVAQVSMNDVLGGLPADACIDLVKMDVEGAEQSVLAAETSWLARVRALVIEWHPDRCDPAPLVKALETAGFDHFAANATRQDNLSAFRRRG